MRIQNKRPQKWAKLWGDFWLHPRIRALSLAATGLHARGMSYSANLQSFGEIPEHALVMLGATDQAVAELVGAGVWEIVPSGGYQIARWEENQLSRQEEQSRKSDERNRKRKWRAGKKEDVS